MRALLRTRSAGLASALLVAMLAATAMAGDKRLPLDTDGPDPVIRVTFPLEDGGRLLPRRIIGTGPTGGFMVELPARAPVIDQNRVNLTPVPIIGGLLTKPYHSYMRPEFRVGVLLRAGEDLAVALDPGLAPDRAAALLSQPMRLLTFTPRRREIVTLGLPAATTSRDAGVPGGAPIGAVYAAEGALLLAPPRSLFYGLDPLFD